MCKTLDGIEPKLYDRREGDSNTTELRLRFLAQDIQQAMNTHIPDIKNMLSERCVGDKKILALDDSRLVCALWSKVKQLEQRLSVPKNMYANKKICFYECSFISI